MPDYLLRGEQLLRSFNLKRVGKADVQFSCVVSFSALISALLAYFFIPNNLLVLVWSCIFGLFLPYNCFGDNRRQQIGSIFKYASINFFLLFVAAFFILWHNFYECIFMSALIFLVLSSSRYLRGGRSVSIFSVIYVVVLYSVGSGMLNVTFYALLHSIFLALLIAIPSCIAMIFIFKLPYSAIEPVNKSDYLLKQALRTSLLIAIVFFTGKYIAGRDIAWVIFSVLIISKENLSLSIKKSAERALGTVCGAIMGMFCAHTLFAINPYVTMLVVFVFVFLTFLIISTNYFIGIMLATIWVGASFYLYHLPVTIDQFMLARIVDSLIGISIGLAGEYYIFPGKVIHADPGGTKNK